MEALFEGMFCVLALLQIPQDHFLTWSLGMALPDRDARTSHCSFVLSRELPLKIMNSGEKFTASAMHKVTETVELLVTAQN